eukprot:3176738-Prymnesium_polylepis.1
MLRVPVFRIPSLLPLPATSRGAGIVLAFAEARPALHDAGVIDLIMRRSIDHGRSWGSAKVILTGAMLGQASRRAHRDAPNAPATRTATHSLGSRSHGREGTTWV